MATVDELDRPGLLGHGGDDFRNSVADEVDRGRGICRQENQEWKRDPEWSQVTAGGADKRDSHQDPERGSAQLNDAFRHRVDVLVQFGPKPVDHLVQRDEL